ncbi:MAG: glutamate--tRNA ligase [Candidatus Dojkabacteria bacterium]
MRTKEQNEQLAQLLFPEVKESPADVLNKYPERETEGMVLRFAPSPTGFMHIGNVYTGLVCTKLANQTDGVSILRIEDTDKEREVENGVTQIVDGLKGFGIEFDEGMVNEEDGKGDYGPYIQSKRLDIYKVFTKDLVRKGYAYPCFMTSEELEEMREKQEELKVATGSYGKWAKWRDADTEDIKKMLDSNEEFVIRLYSTGDPEKSFNFKDLIKGGVTLRENNMDAILLKSDGYPTYHLAHPIDDTLMRITHVIRGDEWFSSLPLHVELFDKLGFDLLPYAHVSPLMKSDEGKKRKLSKRKDPEAAVSYYIERGYPKKGIIEYLLNIANSSFYDWRIQNPDKSLDEFELKFDRFNSSGALFDVVKLDNICKNYIATLSAEEVYEKALQWARDFDEEIANLLENNKEYCISIFNIERTGDKIRKDLVKFQDVRDQMSIFFDDLLSKEDIPDITERVGEEDQKAILTKYLEIFEIGDSSDEWFEKIRNLSKDLGFEKVGDVAMVLRVAITHRTQTPDLYQVIRVLGEEKVRERIKNYTDLMI